MLVVDIVVHESLVHSLKSVACVSAFFFSGLGVYRHSRPDFLALPQVVINVRGALVVAVHGLFVGVIHCVGDLFEEFWCRREHRYLASFS